MKINKYILIFITIFLFQQRVSSQYKLLIGTYTNTGKSEGIYCYNITIKKKTAEQLSVTSGISNPSYLAISNDKKFVYAVSESTDASTAQAFSFNKTTGKLNHINSSATKGKGPCYITTSKNHVFTANYGGGSISVFGKTKSGELTEVKQVIQHAGKSINTERQNEPHVHQVLLSPDKKYILSNDLGTDQVIIYKYNPLASTDILLPTDTLKVKSGSGPRHATFSKNGKKIFLVQEIDGTVSEINLKDEQLSLQQETTLEKDTNLVNRAADIHLSPDEKFVYVTNRGTANDITCYSVSENGTLKYIQQLPTGGNGPRNFAITPDGNYLFVAHQFTDNITIFERNKKTGELTQTDFEIAIGAPVCLKFF